MKNVSVLLAIVTLAACRTPDSPAQPQTAPSRASAPARATAPATPAGGASLYQRLGGYDAIAAVTDDFLGRMIADKQLGKYFVGLSQNSREVLREHVIELLCYTAQGPCLYVGRDIGEAHTGLHISESDWDVAVKHLNGTLDKFKVPQRERGELVAAVASFKEDIVGK